MISWPQNVVIAKSCSLSLQGYVLFRLGILQCVCVCVDTWVCVCKKRRELAFSGGSRVLKAGVPVILMDV